MWIGDQLRGDHEAPRLRIDAAYRSGPDERVEIYVHGDFDISGVDVFRSCVTSALQSPTRRVEVHLDGVAVFGSAAARVLREMLDLADGLACDLSVAGVPRTVARVLDILEIDDVRVIRQNDHHDAVPLPPIVFDSVVARGVLHGRESVCVTTDDVDDPTIVFVNAAFTGLTGFTADTVLGLNPRFLQGALTDRHIIEELKLCLRSGEEFNGEAVNYRVDGSPFWMNWKIVPIDVASRSYFVGLQRDATAARQHQRLATARGRLDRAIERHRLVGNIAIVLDALQDCVELLIEAPDARVVVAVTDRKGTIVEVCSDAIGVDSTSFGSTRRRQSLKIDTAETQIPTPITSGHTLHIQIGDVHPDWLRLVDEQHFTTLADAVQPALAAFVNEQ